MTTPAIFRPDDPIGRGIEQLVAQRPGAARFLDRGRYGHPFAGWRAQIALLVARIAAEVEASRLPLATGRALLDLAASEFDTALPIEPISAVGEVVLRRTAGTLPAGVVRKGSKWRRPADPADAYVAKSQVEYESLGDTIIAQGARDAIVKIRATRAGSHANVPIGPGPLENALHANDIRPASALFDPNLLPALGMAAGGADGTSEELLRRAARAYALGRYGPTIGAIGAAALRSGAVHASVFEVPSRGVTLVLANDIAWATSVTWVSQIAQAILDEFAGFGCRVMVSGSTNQFVRVECTVTLRDGAFLADTTEITAALGQAVRSYFDDRPDWWTWRFGALRGVCARAHRRILTCSSVVVRDAQTNTLLGEPTFDPKLGHFDGGNRPYHYFLSDDAVQPTYLVPN